MIDNYLNIKSIDPKYWGYSGWVFLNSIALTYDINNKESYKKLIEQLPYTLPCKMCGNNLKKNLYNLDEALESKETFISWLINVRNEIYIENNQREKWKTLDSTIKEIFNKNNNNYYYEYLSIFFSIILLIILIIIFINFNE